MLLDRYLDLLSFSPNCIVNTVTHAAIAAGGSSTTVAVSLRDAHLPSRLRRKMDEHCVIGNHVGFVGLVTAGGQGTDASVVQAGPRCCISECIPRWSAWA